MSEHESEQEQEIYATLVEIKQEPTELYKILKFESLVSGGGEAKQVIAEGYVLLNGEVETRKRKKVYAGDLISFNQQHYQVALKGETAEYEVFEQQESSEVDRLPQDNQSNNQSSKQVNSKDKQPPMKKKRKPINF